MVKSSHLQPNCPPLIGLSIFMQPNLNQQTTALKQPANTWKMESNINRMRIN